MATLKKKMNINEILSNIYKNVMKECKERDYEIDDQLVHFIVHLLSQDTYFGLNPDLINACRVQDFFKQAVEKCIDPLDPTGCNLKLVFFFKSCKKLDFETVRKNYEENFNRRMDKLVEEILQYPETSSKAQLEEMFFKIQVFTITAYGLGQPNNHVLLKYARQGLESVISRNDLRDYVLKKKWNRLEYLKRLCATVCGILIFENHGKRCDKENFHDLICDIKMALENTKQFLHGDRKRADYWKTFGVNTILSLITLEPEKQVIKCQYQIEKLRDINASVCLYNMYERFLDILIEHFEKTEYLIAVAIERYRCVVERIMDVLKFRTAIESKLVFPHFVYLAELWNLLILYLEHLKRINEIKMEMDKLVSVSFDDKFLKSCEIALEKSENLMMESILTFDEMLTRANRRRVNVNLLKLKDHLKNHCTLTTTITNGLIVPATIQKKLCENLKLQFGFRNLQIAKWAERNFEVYLKTFCNVVYASVDLILLYEVEDFVLEQYLNYNISKTDISAKSNEVGTQTEMVVTNDLSIPNWINVTWNIWDYYREAIRLANLRRCQTKQSQTLYSYGKRNAQVEANSPRRYQ